MDPQIFWDSIGSQSLEDFLLPPNGTSMPFANATTQEGVSMDIWNSGASSSTQPPHTEGNREDPKVENAYTASLSSNRGGALRIGGRRTEPVNTLSLGSPNIDIWNSGAPVSSQLQHTEVNRDETKMETGGGIPRIGGRRSEPVNTLCFGSASIDLNNHHIDNSQPSFQSFSPNDLPQNFDNIVGHVGTISQVQDVGSSRTGPLSSGGSYNTRGNSSRGFGNYSGNSEGRSGGSSDGRRASKRKLNEGVADQESARGSGSSSFSHQGENNTAVHSGPYQNPNSSLNISRPSDFLPGLQPAEQLNSRTGTSTGVVVTGSSSGTVSGNREGSQRYVRMRINPVNVNETPSPNQWVQGNTTPISNVWSDNQSALHAHFQSLRSTPVVTGTSSQSALSIPVIPRLPRNAQLRNGAPSRRIGSTPSNPIIVGDRPVASREEGNSSSIPRSNPIEISALPPAPDVTQLPFPPIFGLPEGNASIPETVIPAPHIGQPPPLMLGLPARGTGRHVSFVPASRSGTSSGVTPSLGTTTASHQNSPLRYHRSFSEVIRRSLFNASSAAYQAANVASQPLTQTEMPQNIVRPSAVRVQERPQAPRHQDDVPAIPVSLQGFAAVREGRSRMINEIRNAIDLMRRGETVRIEDMFLFDHPFFHGGPDLLDRHRDMRLDVDRMSYEELLALEERIGNVSTGLNEETIDKCLKQMPHVPITGKALEEVEPCCVCQEEYVEGDELGKLDCGHDFHAACIKLWLLQKNLCPICKTTALKSAGK